LREEALLGKGKGLGKNNFPGERKSVLPHRLKCINAAQKEKKREKASPQRGGRPDSSNLSACRKKAAVRGNRLCPRKKQSPAVGKRKNSISALPRGKAVVLPLRIEKKLAKVRDQGGCYSWGGNRKPYFALSGGGKNNHLLKGKERGRAQPLERENTCMIAQDQGEGRDTFIASSGGEKIIFLLRKKNKTRHGKFFSISKGLMEKESIRAIEK